MFFRHKDILQGEFLEDYYLLAYKSLMWLDWTSKKCSKVRILRRQKFLVSLILSGVV